MPSRAVKQDQSHQQISFSHDQLKPLSAERIDHPQSLQPRFTRGNRAIQRLLQSQPRNPELPSTMRRPTFTAHNPSRQPVRELGEQGIMGSGGSLPHLDEIQRAFGPHDISHIRTHRSPDAKATTKAMGAIAYTIGDQIAFAGSPDLHTAAHEATHVVQQRHGVQLVEGVGQAGDAYERHADAVADLVVKGHSARTLLDHIPSASGTVGTSPTIGASSKTSEGVQMQRAQKTEPKQSTEDPKATLLKSSFQNMLEKQALKEKLYGVIAHELASAYLASRKPRLMSTPYGLRDLNFTIQASHADVYDAILNAMDTTNTNAATNWNWSPPPSPPKGGTRDKAIVEFENWVGDQLIDEGKDKLRELAIEEVAVSCAARWTAAEGLVVVAKIVVGALNVVGWIAMATSVLELLIVLQKPVEKSSKAEMIVADVKNWLTAGRRFDELFKASQKAKETKKSLSSYSEDPSNPLAPVYTRSIH